MKLLISILVSVISLSLAVIHIFNPEIAIDAITLSFVILAILPWVLPWVKALEFPGGAKIEFKDVEKATEKVINTESNAALVVEAKEKEALDVDDPNLLLVALRIEIEKRLKKLAVKHQIAVSKGGLTSIVRELMKKEVLAQGEVGGLLDLINIGNRAAHGDSVESGASDWARDVGPQILTVLDSKT